MSDVEAAANAAGQQRRGKRRSRGSNPQMGDDNLFPGSVPFFTPSVPNDADDEEDDDEDDGDNGSNDKAVALPGSVNRGNSSGSPGSGGSGGGGPTSSARAKKRRRTGYMLKLPLANRRLSFGGTMTKESPWERLRKKRHLLLMMAKGEEMRGKASALKKQSMDWGVRSCYIFTEYSVVRRYSRKLARSKRFDQLILLCIIVSALLLAIESPAYPNAAFMEAAKVCDYIFFIIFTIEATAKVIADGFIVNKGSYLRDGWNRLDFAVLVFTSPVLMAALSGTSFIRVLRIGRTLRPLRMLNRNPGLKLIINSLLESVPQVFNVLVFAVAVFLIFGILGVSLFAGMFYQCNDPMCGPSALTPTDYQRAVLDPSWGATDGGITSKGFEARDAAAEEVPVGGSFDGFQETCAPYPKGTGIKFTNLNGTEQYSCCAEQYCVGHFINPETGLLTPRTWSSPRYSFDTVGLALQTLFECATTEGFLLVMYQMGDMTYEGLQPAYMYSSGFMLYMIVFILIGSFFIIQLFIGVTIEAYNQSSGLAFTTVEQYEWNVMSKQIEELRFRQKEAIPPKENWRRPFFDVSMHKAFDAFMLVCIIFNVIVMMTEHYPASDSWIKFLEDANMTFLVIFTIEMVVKITGLGIRQYLGDGWNVFDAVVVVGSWAFKFVGDAGSFASIARIFRLFRVIRVVKKAKGIQALFKTLISSIPSMLNIASLMLLLYFVFAVIGVQLFSRVRYGDGITENAASEAGAAPEVRTGNPYPSARSPEYKATVARSHNRHDTRWKLVVMR